MRIRITDDGAVLDDVRDFRDFRVVAPAGANDAVDRAAAAGVGRRDGEAVWVAPAWLEQASGRADDAEWRSGLDAMVAYAGQHGWVSDDGLIRAHIDWQQDPGAGAVGHDGETGTC